MTQFIYSSFVELESLNPHEYPKYKAEYCPYCRTTLKVLSESLTDKHDSFQDWNYCTKCGWWDLLFTEWDSQDYLEERTYVQSVLYDLSTEKNNELAVNLLISELQKKGISTSFSSIQLADIAQKILSDFTDCSAEVHNTTTDNKINLIGFDSNKGKMVLAIDKSKEKINARFIKELSGAMVIDNIDQGVLFTTNNLNEDALSLVQKLNEKSQLNLQLRDFNKFSDWLSLYYSNNSPNLHSLEESLRSRFGLFFLFPRVNIFASSLSSFRRNMYTDPVKTENIEETLKHWARSFDDPENADLYLWLYKIITDRFDLAEMKVICFNLQVEFEEIPGDRKSVKAMELIKYLARRKRISNLVDILRKERPDIDLKDFM